MGKNLGHRLGKKSTTGRENTIERMRYNLKHQALPDFKYWEFDINETNDGEIIVFHDRDFESYGLDHKVRGLKLRQIKDIFPWIPTLGELLSDMGENNIIKPIRVEIKRLSTTKGRSRLFDQLMYYREHFGWDIDCIAYRSHWKKSFPKDVRPYWKEKFNAYDFHVYNVKKKNKDLFSKESFWDKVLNL